MVYGNKFPCGVYAGLRCFFCGENIEELPYINWMGSGSTIEMHPTCVVELCVRLLRDVHEVECSYRLRVRLQPDVE